MLKKITYIFLLVLLIFSIWFFSKTASLHRDWVDGQKQLVSSEIDGNMLTIHNFRNFSYPIDETPQINFETRIFNLDSLEGLDFIVSYFTENNWIAHTFLSFRFKDTPPISVSIEARYEKGEDYSPLVGLFRNYEEYYVIGAERDILGLRTNIRNKGEGERVYLYKVDATYQKTKEVLLKFLAEANALNEEARFYNTITSSCTTILAENVRDVVDTKIPWSYKIILSGYAAELAYDLDFLDTSISFNRLKEQSFIDSKNIDINAPNFSMQVREVN